LQNLKQNLNGKKPVENGTETEKYFTTEITLIYCSHAYRAHKRFVIAVQSLVPHEVDVRGKTTATHGAGERPHRVVGVHVALEIGRRRQTLATHGAVQLRVVVMDKPVLPKVALVRESFPTLRANVRLLLCMCHLQNQKNSDKIKIKQNLFPPSLMSTRFAGDFGQVLFRECFSALLFRTCNLGPT